jgi:hypothetical protein
MRFLLMLLMMGTSPVWAESPKQPLAVYATDNGSVPPEYHWEWRVEVYSHETDHYMYLTYCKGYDTDGDACAGIVGRMDPSLVQNILQAARDSDLAERPARQMGDSPVGGGQTFGRVILDGKVIKLIANPVPADAERVGMVLEAIAAVVREDWFEAVQEKAIAPTE